MPEDNQSTPSRSAPSPTSHLPSPILHLQNITKTFGSFHALREVDFTVAPGEIVGLLGENGAGKSTLLSIVGGNLAPTAGQLLWRGTPVRFSSPRDATKLGIGIVHQHFALVPGFTVAENVALQAPRAAFVFNRKEWHERIAHWAAQIGWRIDPAKTIEELSVGERQRVEILKALFAHDANGESDRAAQLLLLDEPTANLTPGEVDELFGVLRNLREQGCGLVFVSHKLKEVLALCDRVEVLRRGRMVGRRTIDQTDANDLAELMVGRALPEMQFSHGSALTEPTPCLEIKQLSTGLLQEFSLRVNSGEIVGLAGVDGNGQAELMEALTGLRPAKTGTIHLANSELKTQNSKLSSIPADRLQVGLIPSFTLTENLALHPALRAECASRFGFNWNKARARTRELMEKFDVRAPGNSESAAAAQLSGGNQQKLVIARALSFPHDVVVACDPTRGLDVAATRFVHEQLRQAAAAGAGVLLISTDLDEVLALAQRIGVLYEGRLLPNEELLPQGTSREEIGALMGGVRERGTG